MYYLLKKQKKILIPIQLLHVIIRISKIIVAVFNILAIKIVQSHSLKLAWSERQSFSFTNVLHNFTHEQIPPIIFPPAKLSPLKETIWK